MSPRQAENTDSPAPEHTPAAPRKPGRRWAPDLGAQVPDFRVETTRGTLNFRPWAAGKWAYVFAFPSTFASVCSTELIAFASHWKRFDDLGVKVMGITPSNMHDLLHWVLDLEKVFGLDIPFPVAADEDGTVLRHLGLMKDTGLTSRPSLFVDPTNTLRMHTAYPARMGRSTEEALRCFEGLQDLDYSGLAIPADWAPGQDLVAPKGVNADDMQRAFGNDWSKVSDYLMVAHIKG